MKSERGWALEWRSNLRVNSDIDTIAIHMHIEYVINISQRTFL